MKPDKAKRQEIAKLIDKYGMNKTMFTGNRNKAAFIDLLEELSRDSHQGDKHKLTAYYVNKRTTNVNDSYPF